MKNYKKLRLSALILLLLLTFSCQKETDENDLSSSGNAELTKPEEKEIVLGEQIEIPYSVDNMKKAYENLLKSQPKFSIANGATIPTSDVAETIDISTNHEYLKIWCTNAEDEEKIIDLDIKFSKFPLDREIIEQGEVYIDEENTSESGEIEGYWIYTSLPVDYDFASLGLEYEILEDLFLFQDSQGEEEVSEGEVIPGENESKTPLARANDEQRAFLYELEREAFRITGHKIDVDIEEEVDNSETNNSEDVKRPWFRKWWRRVTKRYRPRGKLQVYNTVTGRTEPIVGVKVRTYRWFVWGHGYTNSNGDYTINKTYTGNPWYSIDFDNPSNRCKLYASWLSFSDATYRAWTQSKHGYNKTFYTNSYGWRFATVNNAIVKYREHCRILGIETFKSRIRVNVTGGTGSASAPMLRHIPAGDILGGGNGIFKFLKAYSYTAPISYWMAGYIIRKSLLPDVWIQGGSGDTEEVYGKVFHEMAHTSHYAKVGRSYWVKYINYIVENGSYGDGNGRNAGICALGEAWGFHFGEFLTIREFGNNNVTFNLNAVENFDPLTKGRGDGIATYLDNSGWQGWMPVGIMQDLMDTNADLVRTGFRDNASGYTTREIYNALDRDVESPQSFRDRLLSENSNKDEADVRALFEAYYWE